MQATATTRRRPMTTAQPAVSATTPAKVTSKTQAIGRTDLWLFNEADCVIDPGFNVRFDWSEIEDMATAFESTAGKLIPPLFGRRGTDGKIHVTDGERRLRAVRLIKARTGVNLPLPFRLEPRSGTSNGLPDDRRTLTLLTSNGGKPLNLLEQGRAMKRLVDEHGYIMERIALEVGCSATHVADCLRLTNDAAPALQEAVAAGMLSATTAVELLKAEPDHDRQVLILEEARTNAGHGKRITARHIPVHIGKERHQAERVAAPEPSSEETEIPAGEDAPLLDAIAQAEAANGSATSASAPVPVDPGTQSPAAPAKEFPPVRRLVDFASHQDAADEVHVFGTVENLGPGTWKHEIVKQGEKRYDLVFRRLDPVADGTTYLVDVPKKAAVRALYNVVTTNGRFHFGYDLGSHTVSEQRPSTSEAESFTTITEARLAALQAMLGFAAKQKTATGGADWKAAAEAIRLEIKRLDTPPPKPTPPSPAPAARSSAPVMVAAPAQRPAAKPGHPRTAADLRQMLEEVDRSQTEFARYDTAQAILTYLEGGCSNTDLGKFILGIDKNLGGKR